MAFTISTGMALALLAGVPSKTVSINATDASDITFGDGDGTGGTDTINAASGLDVFAVGDWIMILNTGGTNDNLLVKALTITAAKIEVVAGVFTIEATTNNVCLVSMTSGSVREVLKNGQMDLFSGSRPANADAIESGTKLLPVTLGAGTFVAGSSENGLNLGEMTGVEMARAIDPLTGITEVWEGLGLAAASTGTTAGYGRWYGNAKVTGASTSAIRMDGVVATSGGDINMVNGTSIVENINSQVTSVAVTMVGV